MGRPKEAVDQPDNGEKTYNRRLWFKGDSQILEKHQRTSTPPLRRLLKQGHRRTSGSRESALGARQQFMCSFSIISGRAIIVLALETQKGPLSAGFC